MRWRILYVCVVVALVSACASQYPLPKAGGLTASEKAALLRDGVDAEAIDPNSQVVRLPKTLTYNPVEVLDSPDTSYQIELERCFSAIFLHPFASPEASVLDIVGYLKAYGIRVDLIEFDGVSLDLSKKVSLSFPEGATLCDLARAVSSQTTLRMYVDKNVVSLSPYTRMTFRLPSFSGVFDGEAKLDEEADSGGGGDSKLSGGGLSMKLNLKQQAATVEIEDNLKKILGNQGKYVFSRQFGIVTVYAPPEKMELVRDYMNGIASEMSRMAKVYVTILQIGKSKDRQHDFDWAWALRRSLIDKPWNYGLTSRYFDMLFSSPPVSEDMRNTSYGAGFASIEAPDSHRFILRMIQTRMNVVVLENTNFILTNGSPVSVSRGQSTEYLKEINRSVTDQDVSYDVQKGTIHSGIRLYATGSVRQNSVTMSLLLQMQELARMDVINVGNVSTIQNPTVNEKRQGLVIHLGDGETEAIVAGNNTQSKTEQSSPGLLPLDLLSSRANHSNEGEYVVILVTPQIIKNDKGGFHEVL